MKLRTAHVITYLNARGLREIRDGRYAKLRIEKGYGSDPTVLTRGKDRMLVITLTGGPSQILEMHFDRPMITVRAVGNQGDYEDGEDLAGDVDDLMQAPAVVQFGDLRALWVARAGGPPTHMMTDSSRRAHFSCSYVSPVASGL